MTWSGAAGDGIGANLRILPGAAGQSLTFALDGTNNINLRGIVLAGPHDYAINRDTTNGNTGMRITGTGGSDHRIFGVLDQNATLTLNVPIAFHLWIRHREVRRRHPRPCRGHDRAGLHCRKRGVNEHVHQRRRSPRQRWPERLALQDIRPADLVSRRRSRDRWRPGRRRHACRFHAWTWDRC